MRTLATTWAICVAKKTSSSKSVFACVFLKGHVGKSLIHPLHKKMVSLQCAFAYVFLIVILWECWSTHFTRKWCLSSVCLHVFQNDDPHISQENCFSLVCLHAFFQNRPIYICCSTYFTRKLLHYCMYLYIYFHLQLVWKC